MRIMGLDYGSVTVGVAISDSMGLTAQPVEVIKRKGENKLRKTFARINELIAEYGVERIVVGDPKHMNGEIGDRALKTRKFVELLKVKTSLPVDLWDERLTSVEAGEILSEGGIKPRDQKTYIDKIAASLILRDYLGAHADIDRV